jgi:NodT family efflux transporter outer membrane factor (OMF) lipoprotein
MMDKMEKLISKNKNRIAILVGLITLTTILGACSSAKVSKAGGVFGVGKIIAPKNDIIDFRDAPVPSSDNSIAWWQNFADEKLEQLVKEAKSENINLLVANSRLKEARAQGTATIAGFAPRIDASANASFDEAIKGPQFINADNGNNEKKQSLQTSVIAASWELPMFGRMSNSLAGSKANVENAKLGIEAAKIALIGDLAAAYIDLRSAQTRLSYLEEDLERAKAINAAAVDRLRVGLISQSDASMAKTALSALEAQIPDAKLIVNANLNRVAILRGVTPGSLDSFLAPIKNYEFKNNAPQISAIPADFVRRRLDVRQAEQNAILMSAGVGIAKADLWPSISIRGTLTNLVSLSGAPISTTIQRGNATPSISLPLFDLGQRRASVKLADARFEQSLLNYKAVTMGAIAEGQQALSGYDFARDRLIAAQNGESASMIRLKAAKQSYDVGLISMRDRIEAERDYSQARNSRLAAQAAYSDAAIALYRAFAGSPQII